MKTTDFADISCSEREKIMNQRTYMRNIPSQPLQPYLDARPVLTKYSIMPIVDPRSQIKTPLSQHATYNISQTFNPGNDKAPWSGYASNVNRESELRNQFYALQECSQAKYVPSSKSTLYSVNWKNQGPQMNQPFPDLFKKQEFGTMNANEYESKIGFALFNNATRQQLKDLTQATTC
jgi:hypothetical protein